MYRTSSGFLGKTILGIGQVDDLELHKTTLKALIEQFTKDRVGWVKENEGMEQEKDSYYGEVSMDDQKLDLGVLFNTVTLSGLVTSKLAWLSFVKF
jgi:hypothetical protein